MTLSSFPTKLIPDICYGMVGDLPLLLDIVRPDSEIETPLPVIVEIHPGGWMYGEKYGPRNQFLAERGFFTVSINHRLSGQAPFPAQIEDVRMAVRWLRAHAQEYHLDPERIGVWGESSGGHLATLLGAAANREVPEAEPDSTSASAQVQAVATISGPTDLLLLNNSYVEALLGGPPQTRAELARRANPLSYFDQEHPIPPFLLIHGTQDPLVPFAQAVLLHEALRKVTAEVTLHAVQAGHNLLASSHKAACQQLVLDFFRQSLS